MKDYLFSIVTICRNAEKEIESTILSVLQQQNAKIEYIIIDGASTDRTTQNISKFTDEIEKKCVSFRYISAPDKGIADAFNKGIYLATGDVIGLINAGDTLLPGALEELNRVFSDDMDIVYGNTVCIDRENNLKYLREKPNNIDLSQIAKNGLIFTHQSAFVKKKLYDCVGVYDISFRIIMDEELFIRFYNSGARFQYIDFNLVSMLAGGISSKPSKTIYKEHIEISERYGGISRKVLIFSYIKNIPISFIKRIAKKNKKLWYFLIGKDRILND